MEPIISGFTTLIIVTVLKNNGVAYCIFYPPIYVDMMNDQIAS